MITNMDIAEMIGFQGRVFDWQREVAGQPVTKDPILCVPEFVANQIGFIDSEWFDEFIPNFQFWIVHLSEWAKLLEVKDRSVRLEEIELLGDMADDIADTAFTVLGYFNARGLTVTHPGDLPVRRGIANLVAGISDDILELKPPTIVSLNEMAEKASKILFNLRDLATRLGISFNVALDEVCRSNESKLWKPDEIYDELKTSGFSVEYLPHLCVRKYRVVRKMDGKLIKSPSFEPPNMFFAVGGYNVLTPGSTVLNTSNP